MIYNTKDLNKEVVVGTFAPTKDELEVLKYVDKRVQEMKAFRAQSKAEKLWKEADVEYVPHELEMGQAGKRFEQDQDTGLRSRMVEIGDKRDNWRSNNSAPTLLVKIQTALALIIDNNPDAVLVPLFKKFEKRTELAYSIWKRSWHISNGKENLKKFAFNLFKYGWAVGRTYPRIIKYKKSILTEIDTENPENNKYEDKELVWFNDIARDNLNPYRTWIDENSKPYDTYSTNDCYFELDYSYDQAELEFGQYSNWKYVPKDCKVSYEDEENKTEEGKDRKDLVTIGFYENRVKDLFVIVVPKAKIVLHSCPLPNDDGYLDIWHAPLLLKTSTDPIGVSIWQIIMQDKATYDKWNNMTSDQLTLSIMKFGFYTGTSSVVGDGVIQIEPGKARQAINGKMEWMEIPGPGSDAYEGLKMQEARMDSNTGISPTLEGDVTGKTLGEIQLARESSLKRLKTPLENLSYAIEQDAYLTLSWAKQLYSTPEVKEFASEQEMAEYEAEAGMENGGFNMNPSTGGVMAQYYPELALHLENRDGQLYESKESQFFRIGKDISPIDLDWRGMFKVIPKSLVGTSEIIDQQTKDKMFNMLVPLFQMPPELVKKAATQMLKVNHEKPEDWLPDSWLIPPEMVPPEEQPLFVGPDGQPMEEEQGGGAMIPNNGQTLQSKGGVGQTGAQTVVPKGQISSPQNKSTMGGLGGMINKLFR